MIKVNGHILKPTIFPDGTSQVWQLQQEIIDAHKVKVVWNFEAEREILDLLSLRMLLPPCIMSLHIPYLPYGRQDKEVSNSSTFNLRMFADLINSLVCFRVTSVDVHNPELTAKLIDNFENLHVNGIHAEIIRELTPDYLVFPDLGARNRYLAGVENWTKRLIFYKTRDQATGKITGHEISYRDSYLGVSVHTEDLTSIIQEGEKFLIIDDICDGGATFLSIAEKLKATRKKPDISLFVTHGIFSKGREVLTHAGIKLFTTNSLLKNADGYGV